MNSGKIYKLFHTADIRTANLIDVAISHWPYGYAERIDSLEGKSSDALVIEIPELNCTSNLETIINAHLHINCGFSYFDNDTATVQEWIKHGTDFATIKVDAPRKELAFELWWQLSEHMAELEAKGHQESATIFNVVGQYLSLDELAFYSNIAKSLCSNLIVNTCLVEDQSHPLHFTLHIASVMKQELETVSGPAFLSAGG
ncbi:hypothetical protein BCT86_09940 [Vibrio breoganii]|uniref:hypothetical protein n=1 Tax=Vibrio breoganii TaxID=553239 RepID=UPI000C860CAB|nr:hypothetical protein [Vibrio breoganii]PML07190.1 hypothetical protein BCT86_09940 [Vibrio breoganii]